MSGAKFFKRLFIFIILTAGISFGIYWYMQPKKEALVGDYTFRIEKIDNPYQIASRLKEKGVVKSPLLFYASYLLLGKNNFAAAGAYKLSSSMSVKDIIYTFEEKPWAKYIEIPPGLSKEELGKLIGNELGWDLIDIQYFGKTLSGMQWQDYEEYLEEIFTKKYDWKKTKIESFLTLSSLYYDEELDFFKNMYVPGTYEIPSNSSRAEVAGILIERFDSENRDKEETLNRYLDKTTMDNVAKLIEDEMILMPDIVAVPPKDVTLKKEGNKTYLLFTTSYWNKGRGPLELIADSKTKGKVGDYDRDVYQRIYHLDGDYTERVSGRFLWHDTHLHYHFQDFAIYEFIPIEIDDEKYKEVKSFKSTFCIRDSEPIDLSHPGAQRDPDYKICGKERQGISPGWADSYYYNYIDQRFDISNIPRGTYKLKIVINPKDRFDEITLDNNVGEALLFIDPEKMQVRVLSEKQYGIE
jgi:cell division protein YceG involved in septum cleavage